MKYSAKLLDYFNRTAHVGSLDVSRNDVVCSTTGNACNGEVLQLFLSIENKRIQKARFLAHGSPALIACAQFVCEWLESKSVKQVSTLTPSIILTELTLPLTSIHVASLAQTAITQNIEDYYGKEKARARQSQTPMA